MTAPPDPVEKLLEVIGPYQDLWSGMEVRYCLWKGTRGWYLIWGSAELLVGNPPRDPTRGINTPTSFLVGRTIFGMEEAVSFLRSLTAGVVQLEERDVLIEGTGNHPAVDDPVETPQEKFSWGVHTLTRGGEYLQFRTVTGMATALLRGDGPWATCLTGSRELDKLDGALFTGRRPFRGVPDLTENLLGLHPMDLRSARQQFEFRGKLPISTEFESVNSAGRVAISVETAAAVKSLDLSLAVVRTGSPEVRRERVAVKGRANSSALSTSRFRFEVEAQGSDRIEIHSLLRGIPVDRAIILLPSRRTTNLRFHLLRGLDLAETKLLETLEGRDLRNTQRQEIAVHWLLFLCGFQSMTTDLSPLSGGDVPDIVGVVPYSRELLVLEVTSKDVINKDKLVKLRRRADALSKVMGAEATVAAVITFLDEVQSTEVAEARELGVAILRLEDLNQLLSLARANAAPGEVLAFIRTRIPPRELPSG